MSDSTQAPARPSLEFRTGRVYEPPRILAYGPEGKGKSTFAAGAAAPIFIDVERGLEQIGAPRLPVPRNFLEVERQLKSIRDTDHDRATLAIDTADALEGLIHEEVCRSCGATNIAAACGGYGKGYIEAEAVWQRLLMLLDEIRLTRGMAIVLLSHSKVEKFESPEHPTYDRFSPALHKGSSGLVRAWCDIVGFVTERIHVEEREEGFNRTRALAKPVHSRSGDRVLRTAGGPAFVAKSRYRIPAELPLDWAAFQAALVEAMA